MYSFWPCPASCIFFGPVQLHVYFFALSSFTYSFWPCPVWYWSCVYPVHRCGTKLCHTGFWIFNFSGGALSLILTNSQPKSRVLDQQYSKFGQKSVNQKPLWNIFNTDEACKPLMKCMFRPVQNILHWPSHANWSGKLRPGQNMLYLMWNAFILSF